MNWPCLNFNNYIKQFFGEEKGIDKYLSFSLQLASISEEQIDILSSAANLPPHIQKFIQGFDGNLSDDEFNSEKFAYRVLFVAKTANRKGQADQVIEFIKPDSPLAQDINKSYAVIKETERPKHLPGKIVKIMQDNNFANFKMHHHTELWKALDAKNLAKGFGVFVDKTWYWYDLWVMEVENHCKQNSDKYS